MKALETAATPGLEDLSLGVRFDTLGYHIQTKGGSQLQNGVDDLRIIAVVELPHELLVHLQHVHRKA